MIFNSDGKIKNSIFIFILLLFFSCNTKDDVQKEIKAYLSMPLWEKQMNALKSLEDSSVYTDSIHAVQELKDICLVFEKAEAKIIRRKYKNEETRNFFNTSLNICQKYIEGLNKYIMHPEPESLSPLIEADKQYNKLAGMIKEFGFLEFSKINWEYKDTGNYYRFKRELNRIIGRNRVDDAVVSEINIIVEELWKIPKIEEVKRDIESVDLENSVVPIILKIINNKIEQKNEILVQSEIPSIEPKGLEKSILKRGEVKSISAGYNHSMIITANGELLAAGDNRYGQPGDGTTEKRLTPVEITMP